MRAGPLTAAANGRRVQTMEADGGILEKAADAVREGTLRRMRRDRLIIQTDMRARPHAWQWRTIAPLSENSRMKTRDPGDPHVPFRSDGSW